MSKKSSESCQPQLPRDFSRIQVTRKHPTLPLRRIPRATYPLKNPALVPVFWPTRIEASLHIPPLQLFTIRLALLADLRSAKTVDMALETTEPDPSATSLANDQTINTPKDGAIIDGSREIVGMSSVLQVYIYWNSPQLNTKLCQGRKLS